jgi:hypothetical protein
MIDPTKPTPAHIFNGIKAAPQYFKGGANTILTYDQFPAISKQDLDNGYVWRYFVRQLTSIEPSQIIEVKESQYIYFSTIPLYTTVKLVWRIRGSLDDILDKTNTVRLYTGVITANKLAIADKSKEMVGLKEKLINPAQFYQGE